MSVRLFKLKQITLLSFSCLQVLLDDTIASLRKSQFIGVGIDESTDRSSEKHVVFIVRYDSGEKIKTTYLRAEAIPDGKAQTVCETLRAVFKGYGISTDKVNLKDLFNYNLVHLPYVLTILVFLIMFYFLFVLYLSQIQGLGVDGASVMLSQQNGVAGLLQRSNPFCVVVHCVCHRLNLAVSQAVKIVTATNQLQLLLSTIYQHINNSPNRLQKFKNMAAILAETDVGRVDDDDNDESDLPSYSALKFKKVC